jgi:hypothetical protein
MESARDRSPDMTRSLTEAQSPLPTYPCLRPTTFPATPQPGRQSMRDLAYNQITVRDGKGFRDRITMLPEAVKGPLANHLERVKRLHQRFCFGCCHLPFTFGS